MKTKMRYGWGAFLLVFVVCGCPSGDTRCQRCEEDNTCGYCVYSYANEAGVCTTPENYVDGCYSYLKDGFCLECVFGYYGNEKGKCFPLDDANKLTCQLSWVSTSKCTHCKNSVLAEKQSCSSGVKCADPNCDICYRYGKQDVCFICIDGFVLLGNDPLNSQCVSQNDETHGCYYSDKMTYCVECYYGFYMADRLCKENQNNRMTQVAGVYLEKGLSVILIVLYLVI